MPLLADPLCLENTMTRRPRESRVAQGETSTPVVTRCDVHPRSVRRETRIPGSPSRVPADHTMTRSPFRVLRSRGENTGPLTTCWGGDHPWTTTPGGALSGEPPSSPVSVAPPRSTSMGTGPSIPSPMREHQARMEPSSVGAAPSRLVMTSPATIPAWYASDPMSTAFTRTRPGTAPSGRIASPCMPADIGPCRVEMSAAAAAASGAAMAHETPASSLPA